jgi:mRNA interferase MazF
MVIQQGDVFWVTLSEPEGSEPGYRHPCVVVQNNAFNSSKINTVVMIVLTSNLKRGLSPGNVTLLKGEAGLPKKSVVNITQILTINKYDLIDKIGSLSNARIKEIVNGMHMLLQPKSITHK